MYLRQSTASQTRLTPRFVDDTDFKTPETGLTIANTDVKLSKNGAASVNKNSGGATHIVAGRYALTFDATDTNTVGELSVGINVSGALPVEFRYFVVEEAVYDALYAASAPGYVANAPVSVAQWNGSNVATPDSAGHPKVTLKAGTGTGEVSLSSGAVLLQATQTGVTIPTVTTLTNAPSDSSGVTTLLSRLSATRAGYLDNLSAGAVATAAKMLSYFQSALRKDVTVDADIGGNYDDATDSQEALRDRGDSAWATATGFSTHSAADVATAVWAAGSRTLTSISGLGIALATKLTKYVQLLARKDSAIATDNATEVTEINADGGSGGGTYANTTDSLEGVRDNQQPAAAAALTAYDPPTRTEATADKDEVLAAVNVADGKLDDIATGTTEVTVGTNNDKTGYAIGTGGIGAAAFAAGAIDASALNASAVDEILDEQIGDSTVTMRQALRALIAGMVGKLSGAATTEVTIRNVADTKNVVVATVDADGNRSAVTLDLS